MDNQLECATLIEKVEKLIGSNVEDWSVISLENNGVYGFKSNERDLVCKTYNGTKGMHKDNELLLYNRTSQDTYPPFFKELIGVSDDDENSFAIFPYYEGMTLDKAVNKMSEQDLDSTYSSIKDFLDYVFAIDAEGYGYINGSTSASHTDWKSFYFPYQQKTVETLEANPGTQEYADIAKQTIDMLLTKDYAPKQRLGPVDLNLGNFLITDAGKMIVVDPGALVSGAPYMTYGEFTAHTFGTKLYNKFSKDMQFSLDDEKIIRAHALLSNLNIVAFITRNGGKNPMEMSPWGNSNTFEELCHVHYNFIK